MVLICFSGIPTLDLHSNVHYDLRAPRTYVQKKQRMDSSTRIGLQFERLQTFRQIARAYGHRREEHGDEHGKETGFTGLKFSKTVFNQNKNINL